MDKRPKSRSETASRCVKLPAGISELARTRWRYERVDFAAFPGCIDNRRFDVCISDRVLESEVIRLVEHSNRAISSALPGRCECLSQGRAHCACFQSLMFSCIDKQGSVRLARAAAVPATNSHGPERKPFAAAWALSWPWQGKSHARLQFAACIERRRFSAVVFPLTSFGDDASIGSGTPPRVSTGDRYPAH